MTPALLAVFFVGYLCIALEHPLKINKTATALLTSVICWTILAATHLPEGMSHVAAIPEALAEHLKITSQIVFFLIGAMTIVQAMESHGGFRIITRLITTRSRVALLWMVSFITFILSGILDNLTTSIVMVSLLNKLVADREDRLVFSSMVIIAANAGGAWTPIGDVTTTMLWIGGQVSTFGIMKTLFIPSVVSTLIPLAFFSFWLRGKPPVEPPAGKEEALEPGGKIVFFLGLGALIFIPVFKVLTGLPPFVGMMLGLGAIWIATDLIHKGHDSELRVPAIIRKIDITSVLFFLGILMAVGALETGGLLHQIAAWMDHAWGNQDVIVTALGIISSVIDNVPLTAAAMGMYDLAVYPMDHRLWEMLAYAVGTGGSILIIGSAAGVVVMGMEKITFEWYLKKISLPALMGYLGGIGAFVLLKML